MPASSFEKAVLVHGNGSSDYRLPNNRLKLTARGRPMADARFRTGAAA